MLPSRLHPQTLAAWLDIATCRLVPSAQTRVRAEIEAHYAEAVQTYLQNGQSESAAQTAALADLGNARKAAHRFCRQYLTRSEARGFRNVTQSRGITVSTGMYLIAWFCFSYVILKYSPRSRLPDVFWGSFAFATLAVTLLATIVIHLLSRNEPPRQKFLWRIFGNMVQMLNVLGMMIVAPHRMSPPLLALAMAIPVISIIGLYLLQRKFRSAPDEDLTPSSHFDV
ncbi:MAG TPA: hypothetical protein VK737_07150 [Opitutales bacterium]|jgi:hypothetical protein|nr:hypothetical protein [Opitutales bacterium]